MNNLFTKIRDKHALWYKGIVFAVCVTFCVYLLPKHSSIQINNINEGDVWLNPDLISPFDFLVKKTPKELAQEKKEFQKQIGYFKKINVSTAVLFSKLPELSNGQKFTIKFCLDSIYQAGLSFATTPSPYIDSILYIVDNNEVTYTPRQSLFNYEKTKIFLTQKINDERIVNKILSFIKPNIVFDEALSNNMLTSDQTEAQYIYKSKIEKGDVLAHKNDVISREQSNVLTSYIEELDDQETKIPRFTIIIGQVLTCVLILGIMMLFLAFFRKAIFSQNTQVTFIFLNIILIVFVTSIVIKYNVNYAYAVPFCLVPILIRVFFDSRTSLFNFLNIILICAFFIPDKFEFVFVQLIAGIGTIFSVADMGKRSKLFMSALLTFVFYVLAYVAYHLVNNTSQAISNIQNYIPFLISSVCVLFSFPLIYLFEKIFGFTSDFTLLELCDLNSPLLRQLSQKIPGTFQHSLQVANLAEEACYKIGGNPLLVRTGAMYHDIGKMINPRFFIENQVGEVSPHEDLASEESAQVIINHVIKGVEIAKENKLPEAVIDFIRTHHGTTTTRYFLYNYKKEHEGEIINEELFRYSGPIPFSKETAVLMMADGVEASSRSLKKYDAIAIDELVDRIINHQINENQFMNADITFRDITQIKKIFKKRLMNIYHVRIEYPR
ncbi:MAG: HDIG domain-containing protein [Burkholderiales bacterium]|nr:HDIG domain-containing protein [Bacteroidia bacterium]